MEKEINYEELHYLNSKRVLTDVINIRNYFYEKYPLYRAEIIHHAKSKDREFSEDMQCAYIESLLLKLETNLFVVLEDHIKNIEILDGLKRIKTIGRFLEDDFALKNLKVLKNFEGKKYSDFDISEKRLLCSRDILVTTITVKGELKNNIHNLFYNRCISK